MALELGPLNQRPHESEKTLKRLNLIAAIAIVDAVLLAVLLWASLGDRESLVHVLGPIHGAGFIALVALCGAGALEDRWDWWFPAIVVVTLGPPGSLIGDYVLRRKLPQSEATA